MGKTSRSLPRGVDGYSVPDAAARLSVSDKSARRLIKKGELQATRLPHGRGRPQVVAAQSVKEFCLRKFDNETMRPPLVHRLSGTTLPDAFTFSYARFGREWDGKTRLPKFTLKVPGDVSVDDFLTLAYNREGSREARATFNDLVERVRRDLPGEPEAFLLSFELDQKDVAAYVSAKIRRVRTPDIPGKPWEELECDALTHFFMKVLLALPQVTGKPEHYIARSLKNFYREQYRKAAVGSRDLASEAADLDGFADLKTKPHIRPF
jgi:hypothetical protein